MAEIIEHGTVKILGIVDCDLLWNSIATVDVLPKEFLNGGGGYVGNKLHFNTFGEVLHYDYSESVVSLCWCKFTNNIDAPSLPRMGRSTAKAAREPWSDGRISDMLRRLIPIWLCHQSLPTNGNSVEGP
jgi:hypothetical protein